MCGREGLHSSCQRASGTAITIDGPEEETQSSFHRNQVAPRSPGPEAELGTAGSRHVLAGWQSRWGSPLLEVLLEAGRRLEVEERPCPIFQPMSGPSLWGIPGPRVWLPCLGELPRAG